MHEYLEHLHPAALVVDVGSNRGSFPCEQYQFRTLRVDIDRHEPAAGKAWAVQADAGRMPLPDSIADLVICNHSLEHFNGLDQALREIGRIIKPGGSLYVSVPDSSTLCDRVYRRLSQGGGHVNSFTNPAQLAAIISATTDLPHVATRPLYASFSYLNCNNLVGPAPRKLLLLFGGNESFLRISTWLLRMVDKQLGTRLSHYGWAFYFGQECELQFPGGWKNVCFLCGAGHPSEILRPQVRRGRLPFLPGYYSCPTCKTRNLFTPE
jgi:SAM-dependent methyltransferase